MSVSRAPLFWHLNALAPSQIVGGQGVRLENVGVGALGDNLPAVFTRFRPDVNDEVGGFHHVAVVFHHDDGVAKVAQGLQRLDEQLVVALVQPDAGLVENVHHVDQLGTDLGGQTDALGLAAGERGGRPVEREVLDAHVAQEMETEGDLPQDFSGDGLL